MPTRQPAKRRTAKSDSVVRRPVQRLNLVSEVVDRLQREIMDGRCPPGTTLPSEGSLGRAVWGFADGDAGSDADPGIERV